MAMKSIILITGLIAILVVTQAQAQIIPPLNVININGNVSCSVNGSITVNGSNPIPPFPNALVQVVCGNIVRGFGLTNSMGVFNIILSPFLASVRDLLSPGCRLVVFTPLSSCNATLPSTGNLQAPLQFVGNTVFGLLNITNLAAGPFTLNVNATI